MSYELFISAFVSLFVVVDPFGTAAVFAVLARSMSAVEKRRIAIKAVCIAVAIMLVFSVVGRTLLDTMHISLPAFRVAGGLLLFVTAFRMIMGFHDEDQINSEKSAYKDRSSIAVFPLAIPLLAGPGVMTAVIMFSTAAHNMVAHVQVTCAIILVQVVALISLLGAARLSKFFGSTGNSIIARIMGILLAAMAVQFMADGITELFRLRDFPSPIPDIMAG
ncbi:MAG TPA: MarC family protein [Micavibrio sp.]